VRLVCVGEHGGARKRIELAADPMIKELLGIATNGRSEAVRLNAIRDALDRAGLGAKPKCHWNLSLGSNS
jgi:hypothetical protein